MPGSEYYDNDFEELSEETKAKNRKHNQEMKDRAEWRRLKKKYGDK